MNFEPTSSAMATALSKSSPSIKSSPTISKLPDPVPNSSKSIRPKNSLPFRITGFESTTTPKPGYSAPSTPSIVSARQTLIHLSSNAKTVTSISTLKSLSKAMTQIPPQIQKNRHKMKKTESSGSNFNEALGLLAGETLGRFATPLQGNSHHASSFHIRRPHLPRNR